MPPFDPKFTRRGVLRAGSGGVLALVIGGTVGWADRRDSGSSADLAATPGPVTSAATTLPPTTTESVIVADIGEVDARIVTLGTRVIEITGDDDLATLLALLPEGGDDPLLAASERVAQEFRDSETIVVDGWVLAISEARAAAVIALICDGATC